MFEWIGRQVTRHWVLVIVAWAALLAVALVTRPNWNSVASDGELQHLPSSSPTRVGGRLYEEAFPEDITDSSIVLLVHRDQEPLTQADEQFILDELVPDLRKISADYGGIIRDTSSWRDMARDSYAWTSRRTI